MITALDKNTALVLIDLQKGITAYPVVHPIAGVIANAAKLTDAFHKAGLPVVIVNVNPSGSKWTTARKEPSNMPAREFKADFFDIVDELKTQDDDIFVTKSTWGTFDSTNLDEELKKKGVTGIVIGGVSTSIGVEGTARTASALGYNLTFATDAMTDMFADAHENSIKHIFPRMGEIDNTENILKFL
jgi:nicotinamidase-related amidase